MKRQPVSVVPELTPPRPWPRPLVFIRSRQVLTTAAIVTPGVTGAQLGNAPNLRPVAGSTTLATAPARITVSPSVRHGEARFSDEVEDIKSAEDSHGTGGRTYRAAPSRPFSSFTAVATNHSWTTRCPRWKSGRACPAHQSATTRDWQVVHQPDHQLTCSCRSPTSEALPLFSSGNK